MCLPRLLRGKRLVKKVIKCNAVKCFFFSKKFTRRRRNRSITLMLFGIIFLFLLCHVGEVFISFYELINVIYGERSAFPAWARITVTTNHLLVVMNSSLNFVIYCKVSYKELTTSNECCFFRPAFGCCSLLKLVQI